MIIIIITNVEKLLDDMDVILQIFFEFLLLLFEKKIFLRYKNSYSMYF